MNKLWDGTPLDKFAGEVWESKPLHIAYFMGQIDQKVFELFGHVPTDDHAPSEAREFAMLLMQSLCGNKADAAPLVEQAERIAADYRARHGVH